MLTISIVIPVSALDLSLTGEDGFFTTDCTDCTDGNSSLLIRVLHEIRGSIPSAAVERTGFSAIASMALSRLPARRLVRRLVLPERASATAEGTAKAEAHRAKEGTPAEIDWPGREYLN
jgi:hypothetical protein